MCKGALALATILALTTQGERVEGGEGGRAGSTGAEARQEAGSKPGHEGPGDLPRRMVKQLATHLAHGRDALICAGSAHPVDLRMPCNGEREPT